MNQGYVKLWRKSLSAGWLKDHKLWALWCYLLLKATHEEFDAIVGLQTIHLMPGQLIFGLRKASEDLDLTVWQIRARLDFLKKAGNIAIKTTNKFSIISIVNWISYQSEQEEIRTQNRKPPANHPQHTRTQEHKNTPEKISEKIATLKTRYQDPALIERCIEALASTRKSNRIADSVILAQLEKWNTYPPGQVETAVRTYLEKGYAVQGKAESYLLGIIRNGKPQAKAAPAVPEWH